MFPIGCDKTNDALLNNKYQPIIASDNNFKREVKNESNKH